MSVMMNWGPVCKCQLQFFNYVFTLFTWPIYAGMTVSTEEVVITVQESV